MKNTVTLRSSWVHRREKCCIHRLFIDALCVGHGERWPISQSGDGTVSGITCIGWLLADNCTWLLITNLWSDADIALNQTISSHIHCDTIILVGSVRVMDEKKVLRCINNSYFNQEAVTFVCIYHYMEIHHYISSFLQVHIRCLGVFFTIVPDLFLFFYNILLTVTW